MKINIIEFLYPVLVTFSFTNFTQILSKTQIRCYLIDIVLLNNKYYIDVSYQNQQPMFEI